jgi:hypothetical protein
MMIRNQVARLSLALLVVPAVLIVLGCSDDGLGKRYPVSGTVKYKGEPVAKARISFTPTKNGTGRAASGQVENGAFTLTTLNPEDGAMPGEYKVTVDDRQVDEGKLKADAEKEAVKKGVEKFSGGAMIPQELQAKALKSSKSRLPGKYQLPETSDKTLTVKESSNSFDIELTD